jgi:hypothetical protein
MLIRMTTTTRTRIAQFAAIPLALFAGSAAAAALAPADDRRTALVVAGPAAEQADVVARARATAARSGAQLRVAHTTADQLGITHLLAASGYDTVTTIGVDRRIAIEPVAKHYPDTRFVESTDPALSR